MRQGFSSSSSAYGHGAKSPWNATGQRWSKTRPCKAFVGACWGLGQGSLFSKSSTTQRLQAGASTTHSGTSMCMKTTAHTLPCISKVCSGWGGSAGWRGGGGGGPWISESDLGHLGLKIIDNDDHHRHHHHWSPSSDSQKVGCRFLTDQAWQVGETAHPPYSQVPAAWVLVCMLTFRYQYSSPGCPASSAKDRTGVHSAFSPFPPQEPAPIPRSARSTPEVSGRQSMRHDATTARKYRAPAAFRAGLCMKRQASSTKRQWDEIRGDSDPAQASPFA